MKKTGTRAEHTAMNVHQGPQCRQRQMPKAVETRRVAGLQGNGKRTRSQKTLTCQVGRKCEQKLNGDFIGCWALRTVLVCDLVIN